MSDAPEEKPPLPLRIDRHPEESLAGFVVRLAERNLTEGWSVIPLMRLAGIPGTTVGSIQDATFPLAGLAHLSGVTEEELRAKAFPGIGRRLHQVASGQLTRRYLMTSSRQVCPSCLATAPVHRRLWHLAFATSCPHHGSRLIRACPECGASLRWCSGTMTACACGSDLACSPASIRSEGGHRGLVTLCRLLGLEADAGPAPVPLSPAILALPTDEVVDLVVHLGWFAISDEPVPRNLAAQGETMDAMLDAGVEACVDWPRTFEILLDTVVAGAGTRKGRYGFRRDLGSLAQWVSSVPRASTLGRLLRATLADWWTGRSAAPTRVHGLGYQDSRFRTMKDAATTLGVSTASLRRVSDRLELGLGPEMGGSGSPVLVETARLARAEAVLNDMLGDREAARLLGCGRRLFDGLAQCGALREADARHLGLPGRRRWSSAGLRDCLERLGGVVGALPGPGARLTARDALGLLRRRGHGLETAWAALASGRLGLVHRSSPGCLRTSLVDAAAVDALGVAQKPRTPGMTIPEASARLGLKQEIAYLLCGRGLLGTSGPRGARRVSEADLATFQETFFVPARYEGVGRRARGWLAVELLASGLQPVSGPTVDGGRQWIFRAVDVTLSTGPEPGPGSIYRVLQPNRRL